MAGRPHKYNRDYRRSRALRRREADMRMYDRVLSGEFGPLNEDRKRAGQRKRALAAEECAKLRERLS